MTIDIEIWNRDLPIFFQFIPANFLSIIVVILPVEVNSPWKFKLYSFIFLITFANSLFQIFCRNVTS